MRSGRQTVPDDLALTTRQPPRIAVPLALRDVWPIAVFAVAIVLGVAARLVFGRGLPLWLDESFTAVIAAQPDAAHLVRRCLGELTGPAYYMPMWVWTMLAGPSDATLRLPSLACSVAAPLLLAWRGHPDRVLALLWASVVLLWLPALPFANEARPYPQLFLLGCVQAILFLRLVRRPTTRRAFAWTGVTTLLALTHYSALAIGLFQGLAYLALHRRAAIATWPALLPFAVLAGWMALHLSFVLGIANGHAQTYPATPWRALLQVPAMLSGMPLIGACLIAVMLTTTRWRRIAIAPESALVASGVLAVAAMLALGLAHSGFAPRYLMSAMPALLFGVACWARAAMHRDARPVALVFGVLILGMGAELRGAIDDRGMDSRHLYGIERPSEWLMERAPRRLVFLWTDGIGRISGDAEVAELAGHVFARAGRPVAVTVVRPLPGRDASVQARAAAGDDAAVLWIASDHDDPHRTVPQIAEQDPRWTCRDFGEDQVTVVACRR